MGAHEQLIKDFAREDDPFPLRSPLHLIDGDDLSPTVETMTTGSRLGSGKIAPHCIPGTTDWKIGAVWVLPPQADRRPKAKRLVKTAAQTLRLQYLTIPDRRDPGVHGISRGKKGADFPIALPRAARQSLISGEGIRERATRATTRSVNAGSRGRYERL